MTGYRPEHWSDFALAQLGASAALLGLVFVGLSINLKDVVGSRQLVNRALEAVIALASVLVSATAVLIPHQSRDALSAELLFVAVVVFGVILRLQIRSRTQVARPGEQGPPRFSLVTRHVLGLGAPLLLGVAGGDWWPAAIVVAYLAALTNAWVLMVEILR